MPLLVRRSSFFYPYRVSNSEIVNNFSFFLTGDVQYASYRREEWHGGADEPSRAGRVGRADIIRGGVALDAQPSALRTLSLLGAPRIFSSNGDEVAAPRNTNEEASDVGTEGSDMPWAETSKLGGAPIVLIWETTQHSTASYNRSTTKDRRVYHESGTGTASSRAPAACFEQSLSASQGSLVQMQYEDACPSSLARSLLCSGFDSCAAANPGVNAPEQDEQPSTARVERVPSAVLGRRPRTRGQHRSE